MYYIKAYRQVIEKCYNCHGLGTVQHWRSIRAPSIAYKCKCPVCKGEGSIIREVEIKVPLSNVKN